jgi:acylphosphatase
MSENETSALRALIRGRVQGVGFRQFVVMRAAMLDLSGYARNLSNGNVEVLAEGPLDRLETLLTQLRKGPPLAHIERVDVSWAAPTGDYKDFRVR